MAKPIEEILHLENIMKVIEAVKGGVPGGILPEAMFRPQQKVMGNSGTYTKVTSTRKVAQAVRYGSASKAVKLEGVSKVPVTLIHAYEHFDHEPNVLALLQSNSGGQQLLGAEIVGKKASDFAQRYVNLRRTAWYSAMTNGKIWFDGDGNLLPSASGAVVTIDFGIPAGNQNQLDALGAGDIISAKWSATDTDIPTQITNIRKAAAQLTGYRITTAYYGANVPSYVAKNTAMKEFLKLNPGSNQAVRNGEIPNGFQKLNWVAAYEAFYNDANGANQSWWSDDAVIFTPDVGDAGWWDFIEGSYSVPTDVGTLAADAMAQLKALRTIFGMFGYATVSHDPVTIKQYAGDTFLPAICVPSAIFQAAVHW